MNQTSSIRVWTPDLEFCGHMHYRWFVGMFCEYARVCVCVCVYVSVWRQYTPPPKSSLIWPFLLFLTQLWCRRLQTRNPGEDSQTQTLLSSDRSHRCTLIDYCLRFRVISFSISVHPSAYQSICLSVCLPVCPPSGRLSNLPLTASLVCLPISQSVCLCVSLSVRPSAFTCYLLYAVGWH